MSQGGAEERPHPETEIEGTGMHEQPLEHVLMPAHIEAPESTGLVQMRTRSLEQLTAFPEEPLPAIAADPTAIGIDRVAFRLLIDPRRRALLCAPDASGHPSSS